MQIPKWEEYITVPVGDGRFGASRRRYYQAFLSQRQELQNVLAHYKPKRVACLGAGYQNDIPLEDFLREGCEVFLVDWIPRICAEGFSQSLVSDQEGVRTCLVCAGMLDPNRYCRAYREPIDPIHQVCAGYQPISGENIQCRGYEPGEEPHFFTSDVTGGHASNFAERAARLVRASRTPEWAFRKAIRACALLTSREMPIPEGSIDLVLSSLVVSQFDHEPYHYFSRLLEEHYGRETLLEKEKSLRPLMEELRRVLFAAQMEGHAREIYRLVEKNQGRIYFSVELFRSVPGEEDFFLVHEIPKALEILAKYFLFDFQFIPAGNALRESAIGEGTSVLQTYILRPVPAPV